MGNTLWRGIVSWSGGLRAAALLGAWIGAAGCTAHLTGLMEVEGNAVVLRDATDRRWPLVLGEESAPLAYLDGIQVELDGRRARGTVAVTDFTVREGAHGLQAWVGPVVIHGAQVGVNDRNTGGFYVVTEEAADILRPWGGKPVLLEGYVEGAHVVRVMYYRPLFDEGRP